MKALYLSAAAILLAACSAPQEMDEGEKEAAAILVQGAAEAKAGWKKGLSAPPVADTLEAEVACTLQWESWGMAINDGRLVDRVMAALPPEVQVKPAFDAHNYWTEKALARQDAPGGSPGPMLDAYERMKPSVEAAFDSAFTGKPGALEAYVAKLAACRKP